MYTLIKFCTGKITVYFLMISIYIYILVSNRVTLSRRFYLWYLQMVSYEVLLRFIHTKRTHINHNSHARTHARASAHTQRKTSGNFRLTSKGITVAVERYTPALWLYWGCRLRYTKGKKAIWERRRRTHLSFYLNKVKLEGVIPIKI